MTNHATFDKETIERESCPCVCVRVPLCAHAAACANALVFVKVQECESVCAPRSQARIYPKQLYLYRD